MTITSPGEKIFRILNGFFMIVISIIIMYPMLYILSLSLSSAEVSFAGYQLIPSKIDFSNYAKVIKNADIVLGFRNSIIRTVFGTALNILLTIITAYPLSKKHFPLRKFWTSFVLFTMFFNGGLIPTYLNIKRLGLLNTYWVLMLPVAINTYNMIIMRNFFIAMPETIEEAAKIDGANEFQILWKIVVPTSKAIIATVGLWAAVGHWNAWFDAMIYITKPNIQVLQNVMRRIIMEGSVEMLNPNAAENYSEVINPENIKATTIMVTSIPIICVYPFAQKYFVKGLLVGSLKG